MTLQFSRAGVMLAAAICDGALFPVRLFYISGLGNSPMVPAARAGDLIGHANLVYDLSWSFDDRLLVSASADSSACVWDVGGGSTSPVKVRDSVCVCVCVCVC